MLREKLSQIYIVYQKVLVDYPGAKARLSGDNPAPIGHPGFTSTNGNKKGTVHVMTHSNETFMSKCI